MAITLTEIQKALRSEDIEGFIALGAPADEYHEEAQEIFAAAQHLQDMNIANVAAVIALTWEKRFELAPEDIQKRVPAFKSAAQKILGDNAL